MVRNTRKNGENRRAGAHLPSPPHLKTVERLLGILPWGWRGEEGEIKAFLP